MRRTHLFTVLLIVFLSSSCEEKTVDPPTDEGLVWETRVVRDIDFVKDRLFFFGDPYVGFPLPNERNIFVYRELKPPFDLGADAVAGRAFIDEDGTGRSIHEAVAPLATGAFPHAASEMGWFEMLEFGWDYRLILASDLVTPIGIELKHPIPESEQRALAITYIIPGPDGLHDTADDVEVGGRHYSELWGGPGVFPPNPEVGDTLVLKLLKNRSPRPMGQGPFGELWHYMWRGVYDLGRGDLSPYAANLEVVIEDNLSPREDATTPEGSDVPYIQIFGLDRFDESGIPGPDGRADFGYFVFDPQTSRLTFPVLAPFSPPPDSVLSWTNGEFVFEGPYQEQYDVSAQIYNTPHTLASFENLHQYDIRVRVGRPSTR